MYRERKRNDLTIDDLIHGLRLAEKVNRNKEDIANELHQVRGQHLIKKNYFIL